MNNIKENLSVQLINTIDIIGLWLNNVNEISTIFFISSFEVRRIVYRDTYMAYQLRLNAESLRYELREIGEAGELQNR